MSDTSNVLIMVIAIFLAGPISIVIFGAPWPIAWMALTVLIILIGKKADILEEKE